MVAYRPMADYTGAILVEPPSSESGIQTFNCANANALKPGWACTGYGEAQGIADKLSSGDWPCMGIVLDATDAPMDAFIPAHTKIRVAMRGSGAVVWVFYQGEQIILPATHFRAMDNDLGTVGAQYHSDKQIGVAVEWTAADTGYYAPLKIRLSL